ncbi:MAG: undecaprenyldiphospho-muramoylpentapeptide beta-N-acetylglucosaminyltransferase [Cyclobacteriaceae bacterium]
MAAKATYRIMISGGGTGGHIYPAIAIANALTQIERDIEILFVGAKGKMEMEKVPEAGYRIIGLWISGIQRSLTIDNLSFPFKLISSIWKSFKLLKEFKPDAVVGVGGYASGPLLYAATQKGIPSLIQEQNAFAGITNKLLAKKVQKICVANEGMDKFFPADRIMLTGNPVRTDILNVDQKRGQALEFFGFSTDKPVLMVLGGSLGARTLNESIVSNIDQLITKGVQVLWQTGKFYYDEMLDRTRDKEMTGIKVMAFLKEMDLAYAAADVVISRAGALSISELCLTGKPVVFVPSPNVAEDHQTKNAEALVSKDAAIMVKDSQAREQLVSTALGLINDEQRKETLSANIKKMGRPNAAKDIANEILKMIE